MFTKASASVTTPPDEELELPSTSQVPRDDIDYNSIEIDGEQLIRNPAEDVLDGLDVTVVEESPSSLSEISQQMFYNHERRGNEENASVAIPPGEGVLDFHSTLQVQGDIGYNSLEREREQLIRSRAGYVFDDISQVQFSKEVAFACALMTLSAGGLYSLMTGHLKMKNHTQEILHQIVIYFTFATFISSVVLFFLAYLSPPVANSDFLVKFTMGLSGLFVCAIGFATIFVLIVN